MLDVLRFPDRVKVLTDTTSNTNPLHLTTAVAQYLGTAALVNGKIYRFAVTDVNGTAWEVYEGAYTSSGTTLALTTFVASSTGSQISLSATGSTVTVSPISLDRNSLYLMEQNMITGLLVTKHAAANTLDIASGACFDPSSNKIINYAGVSGLSAGSLGASQWNQVYLYDNAGTVTPEVVNNAAPPSTAYAGGARQGGTNSNRRWIGWFRTDGSSNIIDHMVKGIGHGVVESIRNAAADLVVNAQTQTSFTAQSLVTSIPRYVAVAADLSLTVTTSSGQGVIDISHDGTNISGRLSATAASIFPAGNVWAAIESDTPQIWYKMTGTGAAGYIEVYGSRWTR